MSLRTLNIFSITKLLLTFAANRPPVTLDTVYEEGSCRQRDRNTSMQIFNPLWADSVCISLVMEIPSIITHFHPYSTVRAQLSLLLLPYERVRPEF